MQSLEDSETFIDLFPDSPTLNAVKMITSKLVQMESNGDQWSQEQTTFLKIMVAKHVAFKQLDKCDWDGRVINHWILLTVSVSYESKSGWELQQ